MFAGLTSRCTSPWACAASSALRRRHRRSSPPATARAGPRSSSRRAQVGPFDEAHRDVQHAVGLADRVDRDDVRMLDLRRDARLALEARAKRLVVREVGRDDLQRDDPVGPLLAGAVDHAHAPAARDGLDDEAVDLRARRQQRAAHPGSLDDVRRRRARIRRDRRSYHRARLAGAVSAGRVAGRVAQWESARFTRERSQVRNPPRPFLSHPTHHRADHRRSTSVGSGGNG